MSGPRQQSGSSAGGMETAARVHGEPLMRMNTLSRWYLRTGLIIVLIVLVIPLVDVLIHSFVSPNISFQATRLPSLVAGILLITGGIGLKFFPSSLGGSPHVYSPSLSLWSYWLIIVGTVGKFLVELVFGLFQISGQALYNINSYASQFLLFVGGLLLLYNLWRTMSNRVK